MRKKNRLIDYIAGFIVGIGAPLFSLAVAMETYPVLREVGDVTNPAWRLIVMRAITFGIVINAVLFFTALNFDKDRVARGIMLSCLPSVAGVIYFQFILN